MGPIINRIAQNAYRTKKKIVLQVMAIHRNAINKLEKELETSRPSTINGELICKNCDIISMAYIGKIPRKADIFSADDYQCEICGGHSILYKK